MVSLQHHLSFQYFFRLKFLVTTYDSTKDYEFVIRNYPFAMQNWNLTPPALVSEPSAAVTTTSFHVNSEVHPLLSLWTTRVSVPFAPIEPFTSNSSRTSSLPPARSHPLLLNQIYWTPLRPATGSGARWWTRPRICDQVKDSFSSLLWNCRGFISYSWYYSVSSSFDRMARVSFPTSALANEHIDPAERSQPL